MTRLPEARYGHYDNVFWCSNFCQAAASFLDCSRLGQHGHVLCGCGDKSEVNTVHELVDSYEKAATCIDTSISRVEYI